MNVSNVNPYDINTNYVIQLSKDKVLVSRDDPLLKSIEEEKKSKDETAQAQGTQNLQGEKLSMDEERLRNQLQARDSEVKAHEAAHKAAGGGMAGAASYTYQRGPDGKMYAIGGEVSISIPEASTPEEALKNARTIAAAAMAPANPSPQDFAVAASARLMEIKAQQEILQEEQKKQNGISTYNTAMNENASSTQDEQESLLDIPA
ncbi:MAG: hypothetical protein JXQ67_09275 [Campylobacterales bacterium]|nr:hypothetical protein [Campylobacterales bacterium]